MKVKLTVISKRDVIQFNSDGVRDNTQACELKYDNLFMRCERANPVLTLYQVFIVLM